MLDLKKIKTYDEVGDPINDKTPSGVPILEITDIVDLDNGSSSLKATAFYKQLFLENETLLQEVVAHSAPTIFSDGGMCFYRSTPWKNEFLATSYLLECVSPDKFTEFNEVAKKFIWLTAKAYASS